MDDMSNKLEQIEKDYQEKVARVRREEAILAKLPGDPKSVRQVYAHKDEISVKYGDRGKLSFADACEIVTLYQPFIVEAEHWRSGCLEVRPAEISRYAKDERAQMDGASYVEMLLHSYGSRGEYRESSLTFWAKIEDDFCHVTVDFASVWKWQPQVDLAFNQHGDITRFRVSPMGIGEDQFRKWGSGGDASYRLSYYWADRYNWESWSGAALENMQAKESAA